MQSEEINKILIDVFIVQIKKGNMVSKGFKESPCIVLNSQFNLSLRDDKIHNRLKILGKKCGIGSSFWNK